MCIPGGGHGESQNEGCGLERNGENTSEKFPEIGKNFPDVTLRVSNGDPSHMPHTNIYISPLQILRSGLMIVFGWVAVTQQTYRIRVEVSREQVLVQTGVESKLKTHADVS